MPLNSPPANAPTIVLGSTSPFRKEILSKLNIPFETDKPLVDETPLNNETAIELVERLAILKAGAVAERWENALVIGSDQVALFNGQILGKPHTHENAVAQLSSFSGHKVTFLTGLAVKDTMTDKTHSLVEPFEVHFKKLTIEEIESYLHAEKPYNCAGSFKSEALGICLFEKLVGEDPNTLVGLPLIKLVGLFNAFGYSVLEQQSL
ncbi:MAG: septum formation inhibitor Maf [Gammaproteobacteria bacterium]|nr:septum formation inhibitor Maf [Gammaproteobacteria bacterium]